MAQLRRDRVWLRERAVERILRLAERRQIFNLQPIRVKLTLRLPRPGIAHKAFNLTLIHTGLMQGVIHRGAPKLIVRLGLPEVIREARSQLEVRQLDQPGLIRHGTRAVLDEIQGLRRAQQHVDHVCVRRRRARGIMPIHLSVEREIVGSERSTQRLGSKTFEKLLQASAIIVSVVVQRARSDDALQALWLGKRSGDRARDPVGCVDVVLLERLIEPPIAAVKILWQRFAAIRWNQVERRLREHTVRVRPVAQHAPHQIAHAVRVLRHGEAAQAIGRRNAHSLIADTGRFSRVRSTAGDQQQSEFGRHALCRW